MSTSIHTIILSCRKEIGFAATLAGVALLLASCLTRHSTRDTRRSGSAWDYSYATVDGDPAGVRVYTLKNGLTVYLARNTDEPRIRSMIAVRAGAAFDPADNTGLAHYLEHLLFNGTETIGALDWENERPLLAEIESLYERLKTASAEEEKRDLSRRIDALSVEASSYAVPGEYRTLASTLGAVAINGYTESDLSAYWCILPSASLEKHLILESERYRRPVVRAFQSELEIVYEEFNKLQDNARRRKTQALNRLLFQQHPYGQQTMIGTAEHLKSPSIRAIRSYFDTYYVPGNMAIVLVGDLDFDQTIRLVDRYFGVFEVKEVVRPTLPKEQPIAAPRTATIYGPGDESVTFGFRMGGAGSRDEKLALLIDMVLNNGFAGLFDIELNANQAVGSAGCTVRVNNDYSVHQFEGVPKEGQTLEDVRDLMLEQIDRVRRGEFDDWLLQGAINDLKKQFQVNHSTSVNLSAQCMHSFKRGETWEEHLSFLDELSRISRQELMDFAGQRYGDKYAQVFMRKGTADVVRMEKPEISPRALNSEAESAFAEDFKRIETSLGQPQFVDYDRAIDGARTTSGVEVAFVKNTHTDLFELDVIFDMGKNHDKKLALAAGYCNRLGTGRYAFDDLKSRLYELGLTLSCDSTTHQTVFHLEGLQDNLETGISLLDHVMNDLVADEEAYSSFVDELVQSRSAMLASADAILNQGLLSYALYGERSSLRDIIPEDELRTIRPSELTDLIKSLRGFEHRIFFYGRDLRQVLPLLDKHYRANPIRKSMPESRFQKRPTPAAVYFVNLDTVQAGAIVVTRGNAFDAARMGPSNFYGPYFDHIAFREIRSARSLAYSTSAAHLMASTRDGFDYTYLRAKTQADKLAEALHVMTDLMKDVPGTEDDVSFIREDQLKRYQAERITEKSIFWTRERLNRRGIDYDIRKDMYAAAEGMTMKGVRAFFDENIRGRDVCIVVVGNKEHIDTTALAEFGEVVELDPRYVFNF